MRDISFNSLHLLKVVSKSPRREEKITMAAKHFKLREDGEIRYVRVGWKQNNGGNGQEGKMTGGFRLIYMFVYMCECVKLDVIPIDPSRLYSNFGEDTH